MKNEKGDSVRAYVFVKLRQGKLAEFLDSLRKFPQVRRYAVITGEYDGVLHVSATRVEDLFEVVKYLDGVPQIEDTNTHVVLKVFQLGPQPERA
ncbi:MAG: hypothetical protein Kow0069_14440 [Promethearchaeota archaeon]